jgi:hypothetical protein
VNNQGIFFKLRKESQHSRGLSDDQSFKPIDESYNRKARDPSPDASMHS